MENAPKGILSVSLLAPDKPPRHVQVTPKTRTSVLVTWEVSVRGKYYSCSL